MDLKEVNSPRAARHPWELTRFEFFQNVLRRHDLLRPETRVLDIGSGDAWFSSQLAAKNPLPKITCWDQRYTDSSLAALELMPSKLQLCSSRPSDQFDLILMLDVLEHVEDDTAFLRDSTTLNLAPGGMLLISVPAWAHLESEHDRWLEHFRRYVPSQFKSTLQFASLVPVKQGGLFHSLLVPRTVGVLAQRLLKSKPHSEEPTLEWNRGPWLSKLVMSGLRADNAISRWSSEMGLPIPGLSLWALCQPARD